MEAEKIILPAAVLTSLYKDTLVLPEKELNQLQPLNPISEATSANDDEIGKDIIETVQPTKLNGPLKHLGDHHKKVLVIVNDPSSVYLNETDFILLTSILNACKLTIADIALVNLGNQNASLHQILDQLPSTLVISFAVDANALKVKMPTTFYKTVQLGETYLLFSNALSSMQGTAIDAKQEKAKLWVVLKQIFQL